MGDAKQTELFTDLSRVVKKHLTDTYGAPRPGDNLPARTAVALLQLAAVYFLATGANKTVLRDQVRQVMKDVFGVDGTETDAEAAKEAKKNPLRLVTDEASIREGLAAITPVKRG